MVEKVFEFLSAPDLDYNDLDYNGVSSAQMICSYHSEIGYHGYHWNPAFFETVSIPAPKNGEEVNGHDLEITVAKNFTAEQAAIIEF